MHVDYIPVNASFRQKIENLAAQNKYIRVQYFSDIREYLSVSAIIKDLVTKDNAEYVVLNTGEEIRLDRLVRLDGIPAPGYDIDDFTCDC